MKAHRPALVAALLTIIASWLAAHRPAYTGKRLAGFEAWSNVVGGILQHAQVAGFLDNRDQVMRHAQQSQEEDVEFVAAWFACLQAGTPTLTGDVKTKDILTAAGMTGALPAPKNKGEVITAITLGRYLERQVDRVRTLEGGSQVVIRRGEEDRKHRTQRWRLVVLRRGLEPELEPEAPPF